MLNVFIIIYRIVSELEIKISLRVPGYILYRDDGIRTELEAKDHIVEVKDVSGCSMTNLVADLANKTKWGTGQEPSFWYWDTEKKGLECVVIDDELKLVFQKFMPRKIVTFVVEFIIFVVEFIVKLAYKNSMTLEYKMEKLLVRRNPIVAPEPSSDEESGEESGKESDEESEENVDPAWMDNEDIFMDDHEVFVSLGLRSEDEVARLSLEQDGLGLNAENAQIVVDDEAENEPRFAVDQKSPKIKKGETFPCMADFRMALRQYAILKEFEVHNVKTDKKRYRA